MSIENGRWVPSIGDPTIIGWVTVVAYFFVAVLCLKAAFTPNINESSNTKNSIKTFWLLLSFFLIALGINKQLDFQTLLTQIGRDLAKSQGWYEYRRIFQLVFIIEIGLVGIVALTAFNKTYRNTCSSIKTALTGCIILFVFILMRASSFHHIDILINIKLAGIKMNWILELGGLAVIGIAGYRYTKNNNQKLNFSS